jgi:orotate phosphoribosyltransferase
VVENSGAEVAGVGYIVDRSNGNADFNTDQYAVLNLEAVTYQADDCPLCAQNIPVNKPGSRG